MFQLIWPYFWSLHGLVATGLTRGFQSFANIVVATRGHNNHDGPIFQALGCAAQHLKGARCRGPGLRLVQPVAGISFGHRFKGCPALGGCKSFQEPFTKEHILNIP